MRRRSAARCPGGLRPAATPSSVRFRREVSRRARCCRKTPAGVHRASPARKAESWTKKSGSCSRGARRVQAWRNRRSVGAPAVPHDRRMTHCSSNAAAASSATASTSPILSTGHKAMTRASNTNGPVRKSVAPRRVQHHSPSRPRYSTRPGARTSRLFHIPLVAVSTTYSLVDNRPGRRLTGSGGASRGCGARA